MANKLIILPGWGQNSSHWHRVVELIKKTTANIDVHVINLPGFGAEVLPESNWGIPEYTKWLRAYIEADLHIDLNNTDRVIIMGHSFGGRIASYLAAERPEWLQGLLLFGAPCLRRKGIRLEIRIRLYKILKRLLPKEKLESFKSDDLVEAEGSLTEQILYNVVEFDQGKTLPNITVPTLLLWGKNDKQVPISIGTEMATLIPNSGIYVVENGGHDLHLSHPEIIANSVASLFNSIMQEG